MKRFNLYIVPCLVGLALATSCSIDNYEAPNGGIYGQVLDQKTGELVPQPVEAETGLKLRLFEADNALCRAQDFYAIKEGTFRNSQLFNGPYKLAFEGANFYPIDTIQVRLNGLTKKDVQVTPYCRIHVKSIALSGDSITEDVKDAQGKVTGQRTRLKKEIAVSFTLSRDREKDCKLTEYAIYWNVSPAVDRNSVNSKGSVGASVIKNNDASLFAAEKIFSKTLNFESGPNASQLASLIHMVKANQNKVYVRIAIRTGFPYVDANNTGTIYTNYSPVYAIELPIN